MDVDEVRDRLFALLGSSGYMPMRKRSLAKALHISDEDYRGFRALLDEMTRRGELAELKKGKYGLPREGANPRHPVTPSPRHPVERGSEPERVEPAEENRPKAPKGARVGRVEVKRGGMGFLISDPPGDDVFIAAEDLAGALSGDLVAVEMKRRRPAHGRGRRGGRDGGFSRPAGRVVAILERAHPRIVGTFYSKRAVFGTPRPARGVEIWREPVIAHIVPDTRGMFHEVEVNSGHSGGAKDGDKVAVELVEDPYNSGMRPTGRVVKVFGPAGEADADIDAILSNFNIRREFPKEVLAQAEAIPEEIPPEELAQRTSYEHPVTFTIDPADAKDHDDAVAIRRDEDGRITLLVHIADVAWYVRENSPIDIEARARATSVYLPGTVYPMLPPKLSNNMCSLKEGRPRLTKTVSMTFSENLSMQEVKIERSYIRSAAFLTYDQVKEALDDDKPELVRTPEILHTLEIMKDFAHGLRRKRLATGSLDLDLPEARLLLDEKLEVKGWEKTEHHWAHELIEDMMLAANRAVAEYLVNHELPGLFRVHEDPDPEALKRFMEFVREFGISLRPPIDRLNLKSVLDRVRGKDCAHTVHLALLTSLKQARYSAECHPHFALNFTRYLHFTSPIRRYPDLLVHRALDSRFEPGQAALPAQGKKRGGGEKGRDYFQRLALLRPLASHCSVKEREAAAAENEVLKFKQMQFLRRNLKESHPGLITGVRDFGLFVELQDCFVEGLVRVQDLDDDYYIYYENQHLLQGRKNRRSFRLGDKVSVRILDIDLGKKEVSLQIV